jgi:RNA methyltransferase, TrmH family
MDRGVALESLYLSLGADQAFAPLVARARAASIPIQHLKEGVLERLGTTRTPQPVLAIAPRVSVALDALPGDGLVLVGVGVSDPGNAGTLVRSAEAFGCAGVVFCGNSVDAHNPKVVRSSAGAILGIRVVEADDPVQVLATLAAGRRRYGTAAGTGVPIESVDLTEPAAVAFGNEARGLPAEVEAELDGTMTIPMAGAADSLNVGMAATVVCFEAARQQRATR